VQTIDALKAEIVHAHDALLPLLDLLGERHSAHNIHILRYLLSSSVSASGLDTDNSGIKIHIQLDSGEPHISCDVEQIRQVLVNPITNSVDNMHQVGRLNISTRLVKGKVAIRFIDTGVEIPQEQLGMVFDSFFNYKDRGIGVRCWTFLKVEEPRNNIKVLSRAGEGPTVTIMLPLTHTYEDSSDRRIYMSIN
jgi:signal transduction histidine kinase